MTAGSRPCCHRNWPVHRLRPRLPVAAHCQCEDRHLRFERGEAHGGGAVAAYAGCRWLSAHGCRPRRRAHRLVPTRDGPISVGNNRADQPPEPYGLPFGPFGWPDLPLARIPCRWPRQPVGRPAGIVGQLRERPSQPERSVPYAPPRPPCCLGILRIVGQKWQIEPRMAHDH